MDKFINKDNLFDFIISNEKLLETISNVNKLVVEFPGHDGNSCLSGNYTKRELDNGFAEILAKNGILHIYVFTGPWNWMRDVSVQTVDDIIDAVIDHYALPNDLKIVYTGGSMGGLGALSYAVKGKHKAISCAVSCPVCDLFAISKFAPFFAASVYFACAHYDTDYDTAVKSLSPLYFVEQFPDVDYFILYCDEDDVVTIEDNALPLIEKMKQRNLKVETLRVHGAKHCEHPTEDILKFVYFIVDSFKK